MTPDAEARREQMITQQVRSWSVLDEQVLQAMTVVPREVFMPAEYRDLAFADTSLPLGEHQQIPPPKVEGRMLQALALQSSDEVLVIGVGNGYLAACAAKLAKRVICVEPQPDIAEQARKNLLAAAINNATVETGDGTQLKNGNHYDAILITASLPVYDERFERALNQGGRLVMISGISPVMQVMRVIRVGANQWQREVLFETDIPPLQGATNPPAFVF
ncbi:MAG TPA: protein-L-isoaspartate O-methyltransferase [Steroidobacteraceae bacterium]|nr:protein-L-isoaspartate O-methyltransferase [Steroidobacteraceae bacterium]